MNKKILLVDDESISEAFYDYLCCFCTSVKWIRNPDEALEIIQKEKIEIVILDIMMPAFARDGKLSCFENLINREGNITGIIIAKHINHIFKNTDLEKPHIIFRTAYPKSDITDKLISNSQYDAFYEKGLSENEDVFDIIKYLRKV